MVRVQDHGYEGESTHILFVTENETLALDFTVAATIEAEAAATSAAAVWKMRQTGDQFDNAQKVHIVRLKEIMKLDTWLEDQEFLSCGDFSYNMRKVEVR